MTTVKVLHGVVGSYNEGDIVKDAPPGLVEIAEKGTCNAATGKRVAELVDDEGTDKELLKQLKARAKDLRIEGYGRMNAEQLQEAIGSAEKEISDAAELKELQTKATELQIADIDKLGHDELIHAIAAAGGGQGGQ